MNSDQGKYLYTLYTHTYECTPFTSHTDHKLQRKNPENILTLKKKLLCKKLQLNSQATKWNSILILYI